MGEALVSAVDIGLKRFVKLDKQVDAAEGDGIRARWEFGKALLAERRGKLLPRGRLDEICTAIGKSRSELQYRMQFAYRHATERELSNAVRQYGSWHEIVRDALSSDRPTKNAAGAHEGAELSRGDTEGPGWKLLLGDFRERLNDLPDESVNLVLTDPPYGEEFLPLWGVLGEHAERLLCSGGVLAARCGHLFLPNVLTALRDSGLQYGWTYAEPLPGANVRFLGRKVAVSWQPWVVFSKEAWPSGSLEWHPDTLTESPRTKTRYVWEQKWDVAAELIATFAKSGHDVLDPFAGSGTFGVSALHVGCRWVGVEQDPVGHAQASQRLRKLKP